MVRVVLWARSSVSAADSAAKGHAAPLRGKLD